jgi:hypothetical protein
MNEAPIDKQNETAHDNLRARYAAAVAFWTNGNQERWSILNNFLVASTILILAWAAVYTSQRPNRITLCVCSIAGVVLSFGWAVIMCRTASFVRRFGESGEQIEKRLISDNNLPGPFAVGQATRVKMNEHWLYGTFTSKGFTQMIPILFLLVFIALLVIPFV